MLSIVSSTSAYINCCLALGLAFLLSTTIGDQSGTASQINYFVLLSFVLIAAYWDLTTHRIPNCLTYGCVIIALAMQLAIFLVPNWNALPFGTIESLGGGMVCGGLTLLAWKRGAIGGGDVKLACAIGLLMGLSSAIWAIMLTHLIAALFVVIWMAARAVWVGRINCVTVQACTPESLARSGQITSATRLPMAGFYALGVVLTLLIG